MIKQFRKIQDLDVKYRLLDATDFKEFISIIYLRTILEINKMEPLTKEDLSDVPEEDEITKEDLSDVSEEEETLSKPNVVTGKDFAKLVKKAGKLGAVSLDYSPRKNNKDVATLKDRISITMKNERRNIL